MSFTVCASCSAWNGRNAAACPRIDFETTVDWKEHQHLLKAHFPMDVHTDEATFEIQFGNVTRKTHQNTSWDQARFESCGQKWIDVSEGHYGISLLNDCKYGHSVHNGEMALTLIKSGTEPTLSPIRRCTYSPTRSTRTPKHGAAR